MILRRVGECFRLIDNRGNFHPRLAARHELVPVITMWQAAHLPAALVEFDTFADLSATTGAGSTL